MADTRSGFRKALEASLITDEDKRFIHSFYDNVMPQEHLRSFAAERWQNLANHADDPKLWLSDRFPKDFQVDAIKAQATHMADSSKPPRGYTVIPMGGGKTFVFSHLIDALSNRQGRQNKRRVAPPTIVLVPTEQLVEQTVEELQHECPGLEVGKYYGKEKAIRPVTVMVYNSFVDAVDKGFIRPKDVGYLFMDEAHRGLSDLRQDIVNRFRDTSVLSAYSATPEFGDDKSIETLFGENTRVYDISVGELIERGHLCPADNYIVHVDLQIDKDAMPENDNELRKLTRIARMKAASEFLITYEDARSGRTLIGETTIGFTRYSNRRGEQSSAAGTAEYLHEEIQRRAQHDLLLAQQVSRYDNVAEFVGSANSDSPNVIQRLRDGKTMAAFGVKYGREGTNIPRATVLLNIHGSNSRVDTMQGDGRVLRNWDENPMKRAAVVDLFTTVNGRATLDDKPIFFHEAINDNSVVKEVVTSKLHIDKTTAQKWLKEADAAERKAKAAKPALLPPVEPEFLNEREFAKRVLGEGNAAIKYRSTFNHFWQLMNEHYRAQIHQPEPIPFMMGGKAVEVEALAALPNQPIEFAASSAAIEAFRHHIRFPSAKTIEHCDRQETKQLVLGARGIATTYGAAFDKLWDAYKKNYEDNLYRVTKRTVFRTVEPFQSGDQQIPYAEYVDDSGDLHLAATRQSINTFKQILSVPRDKTGNWLNRGELHARVFKFSEPTQAREVEFSKLWAAIQAKGRAQTTSDAVHLDYEGCSIGLTRCAERGNEAVCVHQSGVRSIQQAMKLPKAEWEASGDIEPGKPYQYAAELKDIVAIVANSGIHDEDEQRLKAEGWKTIDEAAALTGLTVLQLKGRAKTLAKNQSPVVWKGEISERWLFEPAFVKQLQESQQKSASLRAEGWKTPIEAADAVGLSHEHLRLHARKLFDKNSPDVWRDLSGFYLLAPTFIEVLIDEKKEKTLRDMGWKGSYHMPLSEASRLSLAKQWEDAGGKIEDVMWQSRSGHCLIHPDLAEYYSVYHVRPQIISMLRESQEFSERRTGFFTKGNAAIKTRVHHQNVHFNEVWNDWVEQASAIANNCDGKFQIDVNGKPVTMCRSTSKGTTFWSIAEESLSALAATMGTSMEPAPPPPPNFSVKRDAARVIQVHEKNPAFIDVWQTLTSTANDLPLNSNSMVKVPYKDFNFTMGYFRNPPHVTWYVADESLPDLATCVKSETRRGAPNSDEGMSTEKARDFSERVKSKSLAPEGQHIRDRSGRGRDANGG